MAKKEGYYSAALAGCSDPTILLYFDGKQLWTHGSDKPLTDEFLLFIDSEPFNHRFVGEAESVDGTVKVTQTADEWFKEAAQGVLAVMDLPKEIYAVVLMINGERVTTYVEATLKSDIFDAVANSKKDVTIVSVNSIAKPLSELL